MSLDTNNNVYLQESATDGSAYAYEPGVRGGSIEFDVNLA